LSSSLMKVAPAGKPRAVTAVISMRSLCFIIV
jgi:hypothetical protein